MGYPKYLTDEQLAYHGFVVDKADKDLATHEVYPRLSCRHRCSKCGLWTTQALGISGKPQICQPCIWGKPVTSSQINKLYVCCDDANCPTRQKADVLLKSMNQETIPSGDGFGRHFKLNLDSSIRRSARIKLHLTLSRMSMSKFGARKLMCPKAGKVRSKLPRGR